ncbi:hypothetical protein ACFYU5_35370, partial [Nocardia aobensis]
MSVATPGSAASPSASGDATTTSTRPGLTMSGQLLSSPLKDVWSLSRHMVGHFVENVAPCGTLPGD